MSCKLRIREKSGEIESTNSKGKNLGEEKLVKDSQSKKNVWANHTAETENIIVILIS